MQSPSLLSPPPPSLSFPSHRFYFPNPPLPLHLSPKRCTLSSTPSRSIPTLLSTPSTPPIPSPTQHPEDPDYVDVGYVTKLHGIKGEVRVKATTGFPQLRLCTPGTRWLRAQVSGKGVVTEVELVEGRKSPGVQTWIVSFKGIDTVDKAMKIVGSTLLVRKGDRPDIKEGAFYNADLIGMRVLHKETGSLVGTVMNIFNFGANDLLQVTPPSTKEKLHHSDPSKAYMDTSGPVVWVPFVEAIVPDVDLDRREMLITPPKGLLELNSRNDMKPKKERRKLEWKERRKLHHSLVASKKRLAEMGQNHLLQYLRVGEKVEKGLLARQIVDINLKLFQHAVKSINMPLDRFNLSEFMDANSDMLLKKAFKISMECLLSCANEEGNKKNYEFHKEGLQLLLKSKAAVIIVNGEDNVGTGSSVDVRTDRHESKLLQFQELLLHYKRLLKVEEHDISIPLILVSPAEEIQSYGELLLDNDYFGFDSQKVWLLKEEKLPIVSTPLHGNKIILNSSREILQAPTGSGGVLSLLSSHKIVDNLTEMGVEYVQLCSLGKRSGLVSTEDPLFFGLVSSRGANMGIKISKETFEDVNDDEFDMIFSMRHLNKMCKQLEKLHFCPVPEKHEHMELVEEDGKWVEHVHSIPDTPNTYHLRSSIYSALGNCSLNKISVMYIKSE